MTNALIRIFGGILASIWAGYVLTVLWKWFIIPTFTGAPVLSIPIGLGVWLIVIFLTAPRGVYSFVARANKEMGTSDDDLVAEEMVMAFGLPLMVLFMGWIYTLFM